MTKVELTQRPRFFPPLIWNKNFTAESPHSCLPRGRVRSQLPRSGAETPPHPRSAAPLQTRSNRRIGPAAPRANSAHPAGNSRLERAPGSAPDAPALLGRIAASARNSATAEPAARRGRGCSFIA